MPASFVNSSITTLQSGSATTVASPATSLTAGNFIVAGIRWNSGAGATVSGVTDTAGNTYARAGGIQATGTGDYLDLWYAYNTLGHASNVVTATFSQSVAFRAIQTIQASGLQATDPFFDSATATTASGVAAVTSGVFDIGAAGDFVVATVQVSTTGGSWTWSAGYTEARDGGTQASAYQIADAGLSGATVTATYTSTGSAKAIVVASFSAGGGVNGAFIPFGSVLYVPTAVPGAVTIAGAHRASTGILYVPTVAVSGISSAAIASTLVLNVPTIAAGAVTVVSTFRSSTHQVFAPTVAIHQALTGIHISATSTLYVPTIWMASGSSGVAYAAFAFAP